MSDRRRSVGLPPRAEGVHRVGLVSDTHGWLDPALSDDFASVDRVLHAGDIGHPSVLEALEEVAPVVAVRGNVDGGALRDLPLERVIEVGPCRIALRHIAGSPRRPNAAVRALLAREAPDVLVVGHSHTPVVTRVGDTLWINPGAAGNEGRHDQRTAVVLDIDADGALAPYRIALGPRGTQRPA